MSLCVPLILDKSSSSNGSTPVNLKSLFEDFVGFRPNTLRGCAAEVVLPKLVVVLSAELEVGAIFDSSSIGNPSEVMNISRNVESLTLDGVLVCVAGRNLDCLEVVGDCGVPTIFVNAP